ncbi:unnamed protein product [Prorocentrum cordatum]|uniref:K Homology domain-containing protein n=1 Tax=Prorocentrum cordatum TaxID=2364126 RepID=A0ABN9PBU7_9DINO|nr:unnamed protein product [Polarella glacialis]
MAWGQGDLRGRSRSRGRPGGPSSGRQPVRDVPLGATMVAPSTSVAPSLTPTGEQVMVFDFPSPRLGQLLGYKGQTIQKMKFQSGVQRLHIHDKEKAQRFHRDYRPTIPVEVSGTEEQVATVRRMLEGVCLSDQSELGFATTAMNVDPPLIGKLMGSKGATIRDMTDHTGCYIEIRQFPEQGVLDNQPCLFFAGPPDNVEAAVDLARRFIDAPGSSLAAVLPEALGMQPDLESAHAMTQVSQPGYVATERDGPLTERTIDVPARMKGHLLGLHGQTIETIRKTSGVIKCHMQEKRDVAATDILRIEIMGAADRVDVCAKLIEDVVRGDHTGIGHATTYMRLDQSVIGKVMGSKGQTIKELNEVTGCYIEIQQDRGAWQGLVTEPQLFIAGPPEQVSGAVDLLEKFIEAPGSRLDSVVSPSVLSAVRERAGSAPLGGGREGPGAPSSGGGWQQRHQPAATGQGQGQTSQVVAQLAQVLGQATAGGQQAQILGALGDLIGRSGGQQAAATSTALLLALVKAAVEKAQAPPPPPDPAQQALQAIVQLVQQAQGQQQRQQPQQHAAAPAPWRSQPPQPPQPPQPRHQPVLLSPPSHMQQQAPQQYQLHIGGHALLPRR